MGTSGEALASGTDGSSGTTPTTGEVVLVDGEVISITDSAGDQLGVEVKDDTTITTSHDADLSDVKKGDTVTVTGTTSDSSLEATTVEVSK